MLEDIAARAHQRILSNGGVTLSLQGHEPNQGYAYSPYPELERVLPAHGLTPAHVHQYLVDNQTALSQPGNHLGAWHDTQSGNVFLDISHVGPATPETIAEAKKANQLAIFDLANFNEIPTGLDRSRDVTSAWDWDVAEDQFQWPQKFRSEDAESYHRAIANGYVVKPHIAPIEPPELDWEHFGAVHPDWLYEWIEKNGPYVVHQTTHNVIPLIHQNGLIPWDAPGMRSIYGDDLRPRPNHVYVRHPSGPMHDYHVHFDLRKLDPERIHADEDSFFDPHGASGVRKLEPYLTKPEVVRDNNHNYRHIRDAHGTYGSFGEWAEHHRLNESAHVAHSLNEGGTLAIEDGIDPAAIVSPEEVGQWHEANGSYLWAPWVGGKKISKPKLVSYNYPHAPVVRPVVSADQRAELQAAKDFVNVTGEEPMDTEFEPAWRSKLPMFQNSHIYTREQTRLNLPNIPNGKVSAYPETLGPQFPEEFDLEAPKPATNKQCPHCKWFGRFADVCPQCGYDIQHGLVPLVPGKTTLQDWGVPEGWGSPKPQREYAWQWTSASPFQDFDPGYYHIAPTSERERIRVHGLQPSNPGLSGNWDNVLFDNGWEPAEWGKTVPHGVYVHRDPQIARQYANDQYGNFDVWHVPGHAVQDAVKDPDLAPYYHKHDVPLAITHAVPATLYEPYESTLSDRSWKLRAKPFQSSENRRASEDRQDRQDQRVVNEWLWQWDDDGGSSKPDEVEPNPSPNTPNTLPNPSDNPPAHAHTREGASPLTELRQSLGLREQAIPATKAGTKINSCNVKASGADALSDWSWLGDLPLSPSPITVHSSDTAYSEHTFTENRPSFREFPTLMGIREGKKIAVDQSNNFSNNQAESAWETWEKNSPPEEIEPFAEYLTQHNEADRDSGELHQIPDEQIERWFENWQTEGKPGLENDRPKMEHRATEHRLWWKPGQFGRGLISPEGIVHTWPEDEMTHAQRLMALGVNHADTRNWSRFSINPNRSTGTFGDPDEIALLESVGLKPSISPYVYNPVTKKAEPNPNYNKSGSHIDGTKTASPAPVTRMGEGLCGFCGQSLRHIQGTTATGHPYELWSCPDHGTQGHNAPSMLYHVSPSWNRESIMQHGLLGTPPDGRNFEVSGEGIYAHDSLKNAVRKGLNGVGNYGIQDDEDIWEFTPHGEWRPDYNSSESSYIHEGDVPKPRLVPREEWGHLRTSSGTPEWNWPEKDQVPSPTEIQRGPINPDKFFTSETQHERRKKNWIEWLWKRSAADPDWINDWIANQGPYMYHGTTQEAIPKITSEGLFPHDHLGTGESVWKCPNCDYTQDKAPEPWEVDNSGEMACPKCGDDFLKEQPTYSNSEYAGGYWEPRQGHVYLGTKEYSNNYAMKPNGALVRVDLRKLDPLSMSADEDHWHPNNANFNKDHPAISSVYDENPAPSIYDYGESGEGLGHWADNIRLGQEPEETHYSMGMGSMAYNGHIPAEAIEHVSPYNHEPYESMGMEDYHHAKQSAIGTDIFTCNHCGSHAMTEPKQLGNQWTQTCTACGRSRNVPGTHPLINALRTMEPEYPALLNEVGPQRPMNYFGGWDCLNKGKL